jgi:hypothetical protein
MKEEKDLSTDLFSNIKCILTFVKKGNYTGVKPPISPGI